MSDGQRKLLWQPRRALRQNVSAINHGIAAGLVAAGIARQVEIQAFDFFRMALSALWRHPVRLIANTFGSAHLRVEEALDCHGVRTWFSAEQVSYLDTYRTDNVDPSKLAPFAG